MAFVHGRKDVVKLLLNHQARIIELRTKDICGRTPFMFACKNGHKGVVQLLLEHSKDVDTYISEFYKILYVSKEIRNLIDMHTK